MRRPMLPQARQRIWPLRVIIHSPSQDIAPRSRSLKAKAGKEPSHRKQMPVLPNARHERFAQELAKGKTADEAYSEAGYKAHRGNASTLRANQSILDRVAELQSRGAKRAEVTVQSLIEEADELKRLAIEASQFGPAVSAFREKGILSGKRVERAEHGAPGDFDRMSDQELADWVRKESAAVSKEVH